LAGEIARRGLTALVEEMPPRVRSLIGHQFSAASGMWRHVGAAYLAGSVDIAEDTEGDDDELDDLYASLTAELTSVDLRPPVLMEMALVARFVERLGDHAVEVARQIEAFEPPWRKITAKGSTQ
jgi:phosphate transport system protein